MTFYIRKSPSNIKSTCYKSIVWPILEYASTVWDPYTNVNITKLESVQRRAATAIDSVWEIIHVLQCNKYVAIVRPTQSSVQEKIN